MTLPGEGVPKTWCLYWEGRLPDCTLSRFRWPGQPKQGHWRVCGEALGGHKGRDSPQGPVFCVLLWSAPRGFSLWFHLTCSCTPSFLSKMLPKTLACFFQCFARAIRHEVYWNHWEFKPRQKKQARFVNIQTEEWQFVLPVAIKLCGTLWSASFAVGNLSC